MKSIAAVVCCFFVLIADSLAAAGDWPMWRHDAARSGSTPEELPADLHLQWTRELPAPRPAWPASQYKLQFDATYEPVIAGGRMFVSSTVNDTVTAYDTRTGEELWRYYAEGPVRFAPAVWEGRIYAGSDDARLHCIDAETGKAIWRHNGSPQQRPILGNGRLISTWPVRGGVVIEDGVAYFATGIWPSMGVFVYAAEAKSGKRLWINSDTSNRFITHPHGADSFGSISPQGALAIGGDNVIVPGGRTLPGVFDRKTGNLKHFNFGSKGYGGHEVMVAGLFHVIENQVFRTEDGAEVGPMFAALASDGQLIGNEAAGESIVVTSIAGENKDMTVTDRRGAKSTRTAFTPTGTTRFTPAVAGKVMLKAGRLLFTAAGGDISAYDLAQGLEAKGPVPPVWSAQIPGKATSLLAADEKLFVVTDDAKIRCFGASAVTPIVHALKPSELTEAQDKALSARVGELLKLAPLAGGYAVALDASEPDLLLELVRQSAYQVIAIDAEKERIDLLRQSADAANAYGTRLTAINRPPFEYNFPPYLADLVIQAEDALYSSSEVETVFKMLRPYGGVACLHTSARQHEDLASTLKDLELGQAQIERAGEWTVIRRVGALPESDDWTHQYANAGNSGVSLESGVKAPLGVLWFGGPSNDKVLPRHGHGPSPQVAGGRLFIEGPDMLRCVDVYTGRVWWERDLPGLGAYYDNTSHQPGAGEIGSNYVSLEDHVYVIYGSELLELDARTGETTKQLAAPGDPKRPGASHWGSLAVSGDTLVVTAAPSKIKGMEYSKEAQIPVGARAVVAPHANWRYLKGADPAGDWTQPSFDDGAWETGEAGFGYGDGDDRTVLDDMRGKYQRVYLRAAFEGRRADGADAVRLMVNYDDAFIAYLNGKEVLRVNVGEGSSAAAAKIGGHEAEGYVPFDIPGFRELLTPGTNVLAIEGHNDSLDSSDFSLDPYLLAAPPADNSQKPNIAESIEPSRYATSSRELLAFDRHSGKLLWTKPAEFSFRHNAVCISDDTVYCIDGMSPEALGLLRRRGVSTSSEPHLFALDLRTGDVIWATKENVFGTFLNYSAEHDVLVQGGSAFRDRAKDEVGQGLVAYQGRDGQVLWQQPDLKYGGPCLIWKDRIITNGSGGFELSLMTGETTGWDYTRMHGCNTAIGCQTMLTFRSGAAGFFDLENKSGTGNLGGFRASCTSNLIPADGVLSAPDFTRTCVCSYQLQTSLAFVHEQKADSWTFNPADSMDAPLKAVGLNLGAPGDRRDEEGVMWFDYPIIGGPSPALSVTTEPAQPDWFLRHTSLVSDEHVGWIAGSGARDLRSLTWDVSGLVPPGTYRVRLVFSDPGDGSSAGSDVTVRVQGETETAPVQIRQAGVASGDAVVKDVAGVEIGSTLEIRLSPTAKGGSGPSLCGVAIIAE